MRRGLLVLAAGAAVLAVAAPVALAADAGAANAPVVRNVDTSRYPEVRL